MKTLRSAAPCPIAILAAWMAASTASAQLESTYWNNFTEAKLVFHDGPTFESSGSEAWWRSGEGDVVIGPEVGLIASTNQFYQWSSLSVGVTTVR